MEGHPEPVTADEIQNELEQIVANTSRAISKAADNGEVDPAMAGAVHGALMGADGGRPRLIWTIANNVKTGPVLTAYVYPASAAKTSCVGCAFFNPPKGEPRCYSWGGRAGMRLAVMERRITKERATLYDYSLARRLNTKRGRSALAARMTAIGDALHLPEIREEVRAAIKRLSADGKAILAYTHFWRLPDLQEFKGVFMGSCNNLVEADEAIDMGWRPAVVLAPTTPKTPGLTVPTPKGRAILVCPAETMPGKVTCESCRRCQPSIPFWSNGTKAGIGFVEHGPRLQVRGTATNGTSSGGAKERLAVAPEAASRQRRVEGAGE